MKSPMQTVQYIDQPIAFIGKTKQLRAFLNIVTLVVPLSEPREQEEKLKKCLPQ